MRFQSNRSGDSEKLTTYRTISVPHHRSHRAVLPMEGQVHVRIRTRNRPVYGKRDRQVADACIVDPNNNTKY